MSIKNLFKSPSDRGVKRIKQDAKALAKKEGVLLNKALDIVASNNGETPNWSLFTKTLHNRNITRKIQLLSTSERRKCVDRGCSSSAYQSIAFILL